MELIISPPTKTVLEWAELDELESQTQEPGNGLLGGFSSIYLFFTWLFITVYNMLIKPSSCHPRAHKPNKKNIWKPPGQVDIESDKSNFSARLACDSFKHLPNYQEHSHLSITNPSHPDPIREVADADNRPQTILKDCDPRLNFLVKHEMWPGYFSDRDFL